MGDDSLITGTPERDPFQVMDREGLQYMYRMDSKDKWGIDHLARIAEPYLRPDNRLFWTRGSRYTGLQPYNNFHIASLEFWNSAPWKALWNDLNKELAFLKYHVGDANVHAMSVMMMDPNAVKKSDTTSLGSLPRIPIMLGSMMLAMT
jgi:hypothetical protein